MLYKLNLLESNSDKNILDELYNETSPQKETNHVDAPIPNLLQLPNGKFKFEDGNREYSTQDNAMNAINGFRKFQDKREETSQLIHKKSYEEVEQTLTESELKEYNRSISGKNV